MYVAGQGRVTGVVLSAMSLIAAGALLTACSSDSASSDSVSSSPASSSPAISQPVPPTSSPTEQTTTTSGVVACTSRTTRASLGLPADPLKGGQETFALRYTNTSESPCATEGYPGATLAGPDFPGKGGDFQLRRSTIRPAERLVVAPGRSAVADLTVLVTSPGSAATWLPTQLLTVAPDDTTVVTVPWPSDTPALRQDGASHPGSYIGVLHPDEWRRGTTT